MGEPEAIKRVLGFIAQQAERIPLYFRKDGFGIKGSSASLGRKVLGGDKK